MPPAPSLQAEPPQLLLSVPPRDSPVIWARWRLLRCLTVISRMSAFSSLECRELCGNRRGSDRPGSPVCPRAPRPDPPALTSFFSASRISVFSCPRLSLMRARRRFSMIGLEDCKRGDSQRLPRLRTALPVPPHPGRPYLAVLRRCLRLVGRRIDAGGGGGHRRGAALLHQVGRHGSPPGRGAAAAAVWCGGRAGP